MTCYTQEERDFARRVLGIRDDEGKVIPLANRSKEDLIEQIKLTISSKYDSIAGHQAHIKALEDKLRSARKAKNMANRRADVAESTMRYMLDKFAALENDITEK